jgi:Domain of unknown function (DUF4082)
MKQIIKRLSIIGVAAITAATLWTAGGTRPVGAISSCPTDPLSHLTPHNTNYNDSDDINVGVKFHVNGAPYVTGVKFYKGVDNTGTHVAHLRLSGEEVDLASEAFTSETSSGWQTVYFDEPVPVAPNDLESAPYIVWVSMPHGHYAADGGMAGGFNHFDQPSNVAFGDRYSDAVYIESGDSGLYSYTADHTVEPANETTVNYWVSPIIDDEVAPQDVGGLTATDDAAGTLVEWSTAAGDENEVYDSGYNTVRTDFIRTEGMTSTIIGSQIGNSPYWIGPLGTQQDTTALPGKDYTYTVKVYDACGNASTGASDEVSTASQSLTNIFSTNPANVDNTTEKLVVGMHWQTDTAGEVWGVRFHRGTGTSPTDGSQFRATLWDSNGDVLASAFVPAGNQQTGWIDVRFEEPVSVAANHDYVVGYYSPNGKESYTNNVFTSPVTNSTLTAREDDESTPNGVYAQGGSVTSTTFPTNRAANATWYGIDVNFFIP